MGHSTTDGATGKGLGQFTDTAQTVSDLNKTIELIGRMGNRRIGTRAEREALTGGSVYDGLDFYETDQDQMWRYVGAAWQQIEVDTGWTLVTPESAFYNIVTLGDDRALSVRRIGKEVRIEGHISTDGGTAAYSVWAFIPAGFRPGKNAWILAHAAAEGTSVLRGFVAPDGDLTFASGVGSATSVIVSGVYFIE